MRTAPLLTALVLLCAAPLAMADGWITIRDPKGAFTFQVPRDPKFTEEDKITDKGLSFHSAKYFVNDGGFQLMLMINDYESELSKDTLARSADLLNGMTLVSRKAITLDGHDGLLVTANDIAGFQYEFRTFALGARMYQLGAVKPKSPSETQNAAFDRFLNSFHIAKQNP